MRFLSLILALGAIGWVVFQSTGGDDTEGVIPEEYQQSVEKAEALEKTMQDAATQRLQDLDESDR